MGEGFIFAGRRGEGALLRSAPSAAPSLLLYIYFFYFYFFSYGAVKLALGSVLLSGPSPLDKLTWVGKLWSNLQALRQWGTFCGDGDRLPLSVCVPPPPPVGFFPWSPLPFPRLLQLKVPTLGDTERWRALHHPPPHPQKPFRNKVRTPPVPLCGEGINCM